MLTALGYIDWNVDPVFFHIGSLAIRYYSLFFAIAFWLGYVITAKMFQDQKLPDSLVDKVFLYIIVATVIGSRLGHCLFYAWDYYSQHPVEILQVWKGGLASHGGTLGIIIALLIFCKQYKKNFMWVVDCVAVPIALAAFFIRMGNLMNSEIIGLPTDVPWAFKFLRLHPDDALIPRHPTQIYEALFYLAVFGLLMFLYWRKRLIVRHGALFGIFMVCVFGFRILIEGLKENQEAFEDDMILNMGQLLSIPYVIIGIASLVYAFKSKPDLTIYGDSASKK
ncbi:MAG: prolipoprotein diacylglyceryl transferase [Bacteroidales bacterium]|nr:prolipoprotein diacylglyceryl transferase [Bacteroidales bacterium]